MAFPTSISAAQYSAIAVSKLAVPGTLNLTNFKANFAASSYTEITGIRDMPSFGTPANIIKVPVYGQAQTQSIGAQADAPDLELTINFVAGNWDKSSSTTAFATSGKLGDGVADGVNKVFQVALLTARSASTTLVPAIGANNLGSVPNALIYFVGKIESLLINPARDDAMTATVALSIQSDFYGPYTQDLA